MSTESISELPAVLLLVFNRPSITRRVMEAVRAARPRRLYVSADGARARLGEAELCAETRRIVTAVDWSCDVHTLFQPENLGCKVAVRTAIDWFFSQEEEGIILEDDCLPSQSFFRYCAELLDRYRDDKRVMCISGDNFQREQDVTPFSYIFSQYTHIWGWASWRRAWQLYDAEMKLWPEFRDSGGLQAWADGERSFVDYWSTIFDDVAAGKVDTWDYQFLFTCWANSGLTVLPKRNLVRNIGFGEAATHTTDTTDWTANLPVFEMSFPLNHPNLVVRNALADAYQREYVFGLGRDDKTGWSWLPRAPERLIGIALDEARRVRSRLSALFNAAQK